MNRVKKWMPSAGAYPEAIYLSMASCLLATFTAYRTNSKFQNPSSKQYLKLASSRQFLEKTRKSIDLRQFQNYLF